MERRAILHVDMDAFFAAVEQRDNPELRGKPVIVGGSVDARGVVAAASYEARKYGIHSAMPAGRARRLCPDGIFLPGRMDRYQEVSRRLYGLLLEYTPLVEAISVDEAFLDVTGCQRLLGPPLDIARSLKQRIRDTLQLTASVGVAPNKFLAKIASDLEKPDGLTLVPFDDPAGFLRDLPIAKLWGVGPATSEKLLRLGLHTAGEVAAYPRELLRHRLGSYGEQLHDLARGIDDRPVIPFSAPKSVGRETTFARDSDDRRHLEATLLLLADDVATRLRRQQLCGRTVTLKLRWSNFDTLTRNLTLDHPTDVAGEIHAAAVQLLQAIVLHRAVRLIGVTVSHFDAAPNRQLALFDDGYDRLRRVETAMDEVRRRFGTDAIGRARHLRPRRPPGDAKSG